MFDAVKRRMKSVAMLAVAGALVVGGVAAAQGSSSSSAKATKSDAAQAKTKSAAEQPPGPPPMAIGGPMGNLTNGELRVRNEDGDEETIRLDQGEVTALGDSSITLKENDGGSVTVAVDDDTAVMVPGAKPGEGSLSDLEVGDEVTGSGPKGEAAASVGVVPSKADAGSPPALPGKGHKGGPPMGMAPGGPPMAAPEGKSKDAPSGNQSSGSDG